MSDVRADIFQLEENDADDEPKIGAQVNAEDGLNHQDTQWITELRIALERGCDLGSIRNIGKCRPLTDDLRLSVWKVSLVLHRVLRLAEQQRNIVTLLRYVSILTMRTMNMNTSILIYPIHRNNVSYVKTFRVLFVRIDRQRTSVHD